MRTESPWLLSATVAQLPALGRPARQHGSWKTGPRRSFKTESLHGGEAQAPPWTRPPRCVQTRWVARAVFGGCSLGAWGVLCISALMPEVPTGWLLPRDSKTLVAMVTAALIHQGLRSQSRLQAWWHLLGSRLTTTSPGTQAAGGWGLWAETWSRLLAGAPGILTSQRGPPAGLGYLGGLRCPGTWPCLLLQHKASPCTSASVSSPAKHDEPHLSHPPDQPG